MLAGKEIGGRDHAMLLWRRAGLICAFALGIWCYAPALDAYFAQDDFAFLALVRLLHQPWLLFVHDHFPGSLYFRPLGVFVWWLVCAVAADVAWPQYVVNLALHLACIAALYILLQRLRRDAPMNALWAALYAAHPLAIGTALWLSDRFDLLTTLFSLLALNAALAYAAWPRLRTLCWVLVCVLLALLSKELGVVAAAAVFVAIALAPRAALASAQRLFALLAITVLTLGWLAYRHAMLTPIAGTGSHVPQVSVFVQGSWHWLRAAWSFLAHDPRAPVWSGALLTCAAALWLVAAIWVRSNAPIAAIRWNALAALAAVAVLALLPGLVQAPVAIDNLGDIGADMFWFHLVVPARFFHLAFAGLVCLLMLATTAVDASAARSVLSQRCAAAGLILALAASVPTARGVAHTYAEGTRAQIPSLSAVRDALAKIDPPAHTCQVYFLQTGTLWGFSGYSDAIAKGLAPSPERLGHCLISTERPPWTYFVRANSVDAVDFAPLHPLALAGHAVPPLLLGDVEAMYFTMGEEQHRSIPAQAIFLDYRDGGFVDVSAAVRAGERKVEFVTTKQD